MNTSKARSAIFWLCRAFCFVLSIAVAIIPTTSFAHGVAGQRFFPTTFAVDDPFVSDEFSVLYQFPENGR